MRNIPLIRRMFSARLEPAADKTAVIITGIVGLVGLAALGVLIEY